MAKVTVVENGVTIKKKTPELMNNLEKYASGGIAVNIAADVGENSYLIYSEAPKPGVYLVTANYSCYPATAQDEANFVYYVSEIYKRDALGNLTFTYAGGLAKVGNYSLSNTLYLEVFEGETVELRMKVSAQTGVSNLINDGNTRSYMSMTKIGGYV